MPRERDARRDTPLYVSGIAQKGLEQVGPALNGRGVDSYRR